MVFFDTCIWIELCGVKSPTSGHEIRQATAASLLLKNVIDKGKTIITCDEELLEIILAVQKIKLKEYNRNAKQSGESGCGNIKEYRTKTEFLSTQELCKTVIEDVLHFSDHHSTPWDYSVADILNKIHLADINDCIYYNYCQQNSIDFYTFDNDINNLGTAPYIHVI